MDPGVDQMCVRFNSVSPNSKAGITVTLPTSPGCNGDLYKLIQVKLQPIHSATM